MTIEQAWIEAGKMKEQADELTRYFTADADFDALCKRLPTLRRDSYRVDSCEWQAMTKLRKFYQIATGRAAFE